MAHFTLASWADRMGRASPEIRRQLAQELARGVHEVADDNGRKLTFAANPTTCATARPVELERDRSGRVLVKPIEPEAPSTGQGPHLSPDDRSGFDTFAKSFESLPPAERNAALQKLAEVYIPRLIHD